jgi:hypothetical protein
MCLHSICSPSFKPCFLIVPTLAECSQTAIVLDGTKKADVVAPHREIDHIGLFTDRPPSENGVTLHLIFRRNHHLTDCGGINQGNSWQNKDLAARHAQLW